MVFLSQESVLTIKLQDLRDVRSLALASFYEEYKNL